MSESQTTYIRPTAQPRREASESRFIQACKRQKPDRTPIWLMRQAGRFMPEFRDIRSRVSFLELCKNSELACEVTVMPVDMLDVDAAIIFADILLPIDALGLGLEYVKGEGPLIHNPIRLATDVAALKPIDVGQSLGYVYKSIELTARALPKHIPLIGFAGAPFTLASYMIEAGGSKTFDKTKSFMYSEPEAWHLLMKKIVDISAQYLNFQVDAGADALQLFDSWVGCLSPTDYERFVLPHTKALIELVSGRVPVIHFGTGTATLLKLMAQAGGDVIGLDWRVNLAEAWLNLGFDKAVQGNLDPTVLLGTREELKLQVARIMKEAASRPGHIFNLGHGVLPMTSPDQVKFLVETVRNSEAAQ